LVAARFNVEQHVSRGLHVAAFDLRYRTRCDTARPVDSLLRALSSQGAGSRPGRPTEATEATEAENTHGCSERANQNPISGSPCPIDWERSRTCRSIGRTALSFSRPAERSGLPL